MRNPWRVRWRASRKSPENFIRYSANLMIERGIGVAAAKSPTFIASGSPTCAASCFMRVSGIASRFSVRLVEIHRPVPLVIPRARIDTPSRSSIQDDPKRVNLWCNAIGRDIVARIAVLSDEGPVGRGAYRTRGLSDEGPVGRGD